jgi:hypothetical protein
MSNYEFVEVDIMLENTSGTPLDVAFFTQTTTYDEFNLVVQAFQYHNHDFKTLTANTGFQTLRFAIDHSDPMVANMSHVMRNGLTFGATVEGETYTLRVDEIRTTTGVPPTEVSDGIAVY